MKKQDSFVAAISFSIIALIVLTFFGCTKETDALKIGGHTSIYGTVLEVGAKIEVFKKYGLDVRITPVRSSKEAMAALAGGSLDIILGTAAAGNLNLVAKGNMYIIADAGSIVPQLLVRKDLIDEETIRSLSDLKGRSVSIPREGSASWYGMHLILKSVNMSIEDIDPKYLRQRETIAALEAGHIDAAILAEPNTTIAIEKGIAILFKYDEITKLFPQNGQQYAVLYTTDKMLEKEKVLRKFLKAYLEAVKLYDNARQKKQPEFEQVVNIINQFTGVPVETIKNVDWPKVSLDGKPDIEFIVEMQNTYIEKGLMPEPVDLSKVVRLEFLK